MFVFIYLIVFVFVICIYVVSVRYCSVCEDKCVVGKQPVKAPTIDISQRLLPLSHTYFHSPPSPIWINICAKKILLWIIALLRRVEFLISHQTSYCHYCFPSLLQKVKVERVTLVSIWSNPIFKAVSSNQRKKLEVKHGSGNASSIQHQYRLYWRKTFQTLAEAWRKTMCKFSCIQTGHLKQHMTMVHNGDK